MADGALERYLLAFSDALVAGAERRGRILAEVEEHLRDATESIMAGGATAAEAQHAAVARFGEPAEAAERFGPDPLGRAQRVARWYEAQRIAHPILVALFQMSPLIAVATWNRQLTFLPLLAVGLLGVQITFNRKVRRAAQAGVGLPESAPSVRWPAWATPTVVYMTIIALSAIMLLPGTTTWWQVIWVTYLLCGAAAWVSRLSTCRNPECRLCGSRWVDRRPSAAAGVRYAAWALALAAPGLAALLPVTAGHAGTALLLLTLYLAFAPLPNRGSQRWLWARRPAAQVAVRAAPLVVVSAIDFAREPEFWVTPVVVAVGTVLFAVGLEVRRSRARNAATRRHLVDRIGGISVGLDAPATEG